MSRYKKFEDYLLRVIDVMPEDYLAASDDKMKGLMSRHRTLSDSNVHLVNKLESMSDEVKKSLYSFRIMKYFQNISSSFSSVLNLMQFTY